MLDFFPGAERAPPAHRAVDGIDRDFLSRNARLPCSRPGVQPPPFLYTRYLNIRWSIPIITAHQAVYLVCNGRWVFAPVTPDWARYFPTIATSQSFERQSDRNPDTQHKIKENLFIGAFYSHKLYIHFKYSYIKIISRVLSHGDQYAPQIWQKGAKS